MKQYYLTDRGKVRKQNEDAVGLLKNQAEQTLAIVADGMGGHKAGDVPSSIVRSLFLDEWKQNEGIDTIEDAKDWLDERIRMANKKVYDHAQNNPECDGMGTTVIASILLKNDIIIAHIGDSRSYLFNQTLEQITTDHTLVNELVQNGEITKQEADKHPQKNVLMKALGTDESITPDVFSIEWEINDRLLICTDGLSDKLSETEIAEFLSEDKSIEDIAEELVDRANELGGEDNITVVILENTASGEGESDC